MRRKLTDECDVFICDTCPDDVFTVITVPLSVAQANTEPLALKQSCGRVRQLDLEYADDLTHVVDRIV
jgi:hypothetical protein